MTEESRAKRAAGYAAAEQVATGMVVGIGTGSTVRYFIERLAQRCREGLSIAGIPTSERTHQLCQEAGLPLRDLDEVEVVDLAVDGADEIDPQGRMIKGGGAALVREKLVATHSRRMLVIIDPSKQVAQLGRFGLPVALLPFGFRQTVRLLARCGYSARWRTSPDGKPLLDDNGLIIADIAFPEGCGDPERTHTELSALPGVVETGLFLTQATQLLVGYEDGRVELEEVSRAL